MNWRQSAGAEKGAGRKNLEGDSTEPEISRRGGTGAESGERRQILLLAPQAEVDGTKNIHPSPRRNKEERNERERRESVPSRVGKPVGLRIVEHLVEPRVGVKSYHCGI
jgi:hypothetical protein